MATNFTRIAESLAKEWDVSTERAHKISLHIGDAYEDWKKLVAILDRIEEFGYEDIADEIHSMLLHTPNHLMAAANLMNIPLVDVWGLGIDVQTNQ